MQDLSGLYNFPYGGCVVEGTTLFGQKDLAKKLGCPLQIGLCAALIQVWWQEHRKGADALEVLRRGDRTTIRSLVVRQLKSLYFRDSIGVPKKIQEQLYLFKYGLSLPSVLSIWNALSVENELVFDMILGHNGSVVSECSSSEGLSCIVETVGRHEVPCLYVIILRFWHPRRDIHEAGHRLAIAVEKDQRVRFYDPRWGEIRFTDLRTFNQWFVMYWYIARWHRVLARGTPPVPNTRVFTLSRHVEGSIVPHSAVESGYASAMPDRGDVARWYGERTASWVHDCLLLGDPPLHRVTLAEHSYNNGPSNHHEQ